MAFHLLCWSSCLPRRRLQVCVVRRGVLPEVALRRSSRAGLDTVAIGLSFDLPPPPGGNVEEAAVLAAGGSQVARSSAGPDAAHVLQPEMVFDVVACPLRRDAWWDDAEMQALLRWVVCVCVCVCVHPWCHACLKWGLARHAAWDTWLCD